MHRMHHAFSDTKKDPHSPLFYKTAVGMMLQTKKVYVEIINNKLHSGDNFAKNTPVWEAFDTFADKWGHRFLWAAFYTFVYIIYANHLWMYILLPLHFVMGPVHGSIVNWAGHKYGYQNFKETEDNSYNTLPVDFLALGELFQNNHHRFPNRPNFAIRFFELDPVYPVMVLMSRLRIIEFTNQSLNK